jgi:hypothetical protein
MKGIGCTLIWLVTGTSYGIIDPVSGVTSIIDEAVAEDGIYTRRAAYCAHGNQALNAYDIKPKEA